MAGPIHFARSYGSTTALRSGAAIQIGFNPRDIARVEKRFAQNMGKPLQARLELATLKAADLLVGPIKAATPVKSGVLRGSVKAKRKRLTGTFSFADIGAEVGPTAPHAHLVISGHRVVTHFPYHRDTGYRARANPYVARVANPLVPRAIAVVRQMAFV